jgi:hypothetical protein
MTTKLLFLRQYASNELQKNVIKSLYDGISNLTFNQKNRVFSELLFDQCQAIMNYHFEVKNTEIKIFSKYRIGVNPISNGINVKYLSDFNSDKIINYYVNTHIDDICQKVLKEQYPGINFSLFSTSPLERHYIANENPTNGFYSFPKISLNDVLSKK